MKIAIASIGKDIEAEVSSVGGRSPYYLIFENKELVEVVKNPFIVGGGAGFGIAKLLGDKNVKRVISGGFGGNMAGTLEERGIEVIKFNGKVRDAVEKFS